MKLVRSWPAEIPQGRAYVVDDIDKMIMAKYDYRGLADLDDDVVLIEWDIAVGGEQLERFMARAKADPTQTRVAPYLLYPKSTNRPAPFYCHRVREPGTKRWVTGPEDTHCQMFGFGLVYIPRELILKFMETLRPEHMFSDTTFSRWHMRWAPAVNRNVPIDWDAHCVHLHYQLPEVP